MGEARVAAELILQCIGRPLATGDYSSSPKSVVLGLRNPDD